MQTGNMGWVSTRRLFPTLALAALAAVLVPGARAGSPERNPGNANAAASGAPQPLAAETGAISKDAPAAVSGSGVGTWDGEDPLTRDYPLFGVASYFQAQIYSAPDASAAVLGYFRRGARMRLARGVIGTGCEGTWHAVFGGGFLCADRGLLLGTEPQSFPSAAPARMYEPLPYDYVKSIASDVAVYTKAPTPEQERLSVELSAQARKHGREPLLAAERIAALLTLSQAASKPSRAAPAPTRAPQKGAKVEPPKKPVPTKGVPAKTAAALKLTAAAKAAATAKAAAAAKAAADAKAALAAKIANAKALLQPTAAPLPEVVRMLLQPGFYVSLDAGAPEDEYGLIRTVRGDFIRLATDKLVPVSTRHGTVLPIAPIGPIALIAQPNVRSYSRDVMRGDLIPQDVFRPQEALELSPEVINRGGVHRVAVDGRIVPENALRFLPQVERPKLIPRTARWIVVSLASQTLVAYEGDRPVYATLVSTGKENHETPTGIFRIQSKHVSATMDSEAIGSDDAYSIEDVPWVMYFSGSIALHAAFWHEKFGRVRSHGCVNLAPMDARWLFDWAGPRLPVGWHGVLSTAEQPGTFVVIAP
jgi:hypothetical protein